MSIPKPDSAGHDQSAVHAVNRKDRFRDEGGSEACSKGRFIWVDDSAPWRNQFVRFERRFELPAVRGEFPLHLFADTRYRLRVNGAFVAAGPGRFVTQFPEFDTHELSGFLRPGDNLISVEVNFFGASSYQTMPDGEPGFLAWGGNESVDWATPGDWSAFRLQAWRWDAPLFSFAQNPVEICDTRLLDGGIPTRLLLLEGQATPWGELKPYSGVPIPFFIHRPKRIELAGRLNNGERRLGFMSHDPEAPWHIAENRAKPWTAFATWILAPQTGSVTLSCFWSEIHCNGVRVDIDTSTPYGNHGHCTLNLQEDWNLLVGKVEILTEFWAYCLGIPDASGLSLHGRRDASCAEPFSLSPNGPKKTLRLPTPDDTVPPEGWFLHDGDPGMLTPARMMGWDDPAEDAVRNIEPGRLPEVSTIEPVPHGRAPNGHGKPAKSSQATWCFSFAGEFLGHVVLDVEAPAGSTLDVACDDWQAGNGGAALYQSNPFTDAADRFLLRGGRQRVELFHPRGGKLLQVTLRAPGVEAPLSLHDVFVRSRQTTGRDETRFSCDHPVLEWTWPTAMRTLMVSADEAYADCPWRERGSYIGDVYVNIHLNLLLNSDYRTARRTLRIFAQAQRPDGQLSGCAPSWLRIAKEDFTLIWILALHDYWALTGDTATLEELWPTLKRIWSSEFWKTHSSGLWNTTGDNNFIDWSILPSERKGTANSAINLFRFGAANASARMAAALGRPEEAQAFHADAESVERALLELLWDDLEGRFRPSLDSATPALHANVLALTFGIGDRDTRARIVDYLDPRLRQNFAKGIQRGEQSGHLELYFLHYALPALAAHGRPDLAELLIDSHYGFLRSLGDDTLPEGFFSVEKGTGSRCHSWAGGAAIYAARHVLGIRPVEPGNPNEFVFDPVVHGITRASGRIAHPNGWIEVAWEKLNGEISAEIQAPEGVEVQIAPQRPELRGRPEKAGDLTL